LDDDTFNTLKDASAKKEERWESGKKPLEEDAKFYVRDDFWCDRGENFITTGLGEFTSNDRQTHAEKRCGFQNPIQYCGTAP